MRLFADENVKRRLIKTLRDRGHDIKVAEKGIKNSALFLLAKKEKRIFLTNDTEFLDNELFPVDKSIGIIVLRVFPDTFENQRRALLRLLGKYREEEFFGKTVELGKDWEVFTAN